MAVALEGYYKRLLIKAHVESHNELFQLHVIIYIIVNIIWFALNGLYQGRTYAGNVVFAIWLGAADSISLVVLR